MTQPPPIVLVVEDDPDIAQLLTTLLSLEGYEVVLVGTGTEAIDQVHQHPPDLVLSDFHLPLGDGWSIYQHLRAQPPYHTLPFILVSAAPPTDLQADDPFLCLVAKPFDPPALFTCMRSLLQRATSHA